MQRTEERDGREQKQLVACNQTHQLAQLVKREQPVRVGSKQAHGLFAEGAGTVLPRPGVDGLLQLREKVAPIQLKSSAGTVSVRLLGIGSVDWRSRRVTAASGALMLSRNDSSCVSSEIECACGTRGT